MCRPPFICSTPSPREVATPITVATTASTSRESEINWRRGSPLVTGSTMVETSPGRSLRNWKKAMISPTRLNAAHWLRPQWKKLYCMATSAARALPGSASRWGGAIKCWIGSAMP